MEGAQMWIHMQANFYASNTSHSTALRQHVSAHAFTTVYLPAMHVVCLQDDSWQDCNDTVHV